MMLNIIVIITLMVGTWAMASDTNDSLSANAANASITAELTLAPDHVVIGRIRSNFKKLYLDEGARIETVKTILTEIKAACSTLKTDEEIRLKIEQLDDDIEKKYGVNLDYGFRYLNELLIITATEQTVQAGVYSVIEYRYQVTPAGQDLNRFIKKYIKKDSLISQKTLSDSWVETSRYLDPEDKFTKNPLSPQN
ncbi:hypothetical protein [Candidatus Finniella inopinata]|uniref:Uncharacterized protein n=1 Tax=Candidatus Finniella inopinata TaxID=1696036 RepID=A0A4Q7DI15_9PROT|nr:hypothetical protein [Candidatus Finniella inopinata]RZI46601.1 hypothetical protein EQU50_03165 [Candidatus Finniella inopinata]